MAHAHTLARHDFSRPRASERATSCCGIGTARPRRERCISAPAGVRGAILSKRDPGQTRKFVRGRSHVYVVRYIFSNGRNGHRGWMDPGRKYDEQTPRAYVCDDNVVSLFFELQYVIDYIYRVLLL